MKGEDVFYIAVSIVSLFGVLLVFALVIGALGWLLGWW